VINTDPYNKKEKGLVSIPIPRGETLWVHSVLLKASNELL